MMVWSAGYLGGVVGIERERILAVLPGAELEHVGPLIDMLLVVEAAADEASYVPALQSAGYRVTSREGGGHQRRVLDGPGGQVHVLSRGCALVRRHRMLRDWLRADEADRELFARAGDEVVLEILERAYLAWRLPSDDVEFVSETVPLNAPVVLEDYNPEWPRWYAVQEAGIRAALGDVAVRVEHVGSTSVPGLAAKPLIDILLVVPDSSDEDAYVPALVAAGYYLRLRERGWHEHRLLKYPEPNVNVHVFSPACEELDRMLGFRDRLRSHPGDLAEYERTKRELASRTWDRVQDYADAKTRVVERIILRALS